MTFRYREMLPTTQERELANKVIEVCSEQLQIKQPTLVFISESPSGDISQENSILGLAGATKIYVLRGLSPRELVKTVCHECKHIQQRTRGTFNLYLRENDSRVFEYQFTENLRGFTHNELLAELIVREYSRPRKPTPTPTKKPTVAPQPAKEKLVYGAPVADYIRFAENLLQRLPMTATTQRKNILEKLSTVKKEMAQTCRT